jgi:hypothetical protein
MDAYNNLKQKLDRTLEQWEKDSDALAEMESQ